MPSKKFNQAEVAYLSAAFKTEEIFALCSSSQFTPAVKKLFDDFNKKNLGDGPKKAKVSLVKVFNCVVRVTNGYTSSQQLRNWLVNHYGKYVKEHGFPELGQPFKLSDQAHADGFQWFVDRRNEDNKKPKRDKMNIGQYYALCRAIYHGDPPAGYSGLTKSEREAYEEKATRLAVELAQNGSRSLSLE